MKKYDKGYYSKANKRKVYLNFFPILGIYIYISKSGSDNIFRYIEELKHEKKSCRLEQAVASYHFYLTDNISYIHHSTLLIFQLNLKRFTMVNSISTPLLTQ